MRISHYVTRRYATTPKCDCHPAPSVGKLAYYHSSADIQLNGFKVRHNLKRLILNDPKITCKKLYFTPLVIRLVSHAFSFFA